MLQEAFFKNLLDIGDVGESYWALHGAEGAGRSFSMFTLQEDKGLTVLEGEYIIHSSRRILLAGFRQETSE